MLARGPSRRSATRNPGARPDFRFPPAMRKSSVRRFGRILGQLVPHPTLSSRSEPSNVVETISDGRIMCSTRITSCVAAFGPRGNWMRHNAPLLPSGQPKSVLRGAMSVAGLFAGIGGFELAFSRAGFKTRLLVEVDPAARAVLKTRFPDAEVRSDVCDLSSLPPDNTIVTAGFPCQNLSMAGDKSGISGPKSGVVGKLFELIMRHQPATVVIENVYFMLQLDSGRAMEWLVTQFERLGYHWAYRVVDTMGFGLPQRRRRVYLLACRNVDPRRILFADNDPIANIPTLSLTRPLGFYWTEGRSGVGLTVDGIPPLKVGSALGIPSPPAVLFPDGEVLTPSLPACEELQGFPRGWTDVVGINKGRNPAWRMVGNAVSVPVAQWVARRLKTPGTVLELTQTSISKGNRWPQGGWNVGEGRVGIAASAKPVLTEAPSISQFRDTSWSRLSDRALNGFIDRAENGGLRMPENFLDTLRKATRKTPTLR